MHHSVATVPLAVTAGMLYARAAAASIRPGPCRLFAFTPVLALLVLPFSIPLYGARGLAAFFLVWLGEFKLLFLAFGRGPLDPALLPLLFVFTAALPVRLRRRSRSQAADDDAAVATAAGTPLKKTAAGTVALPLLSSGVKVAVLASTVRLLSRSKDTI